MKINLSIRNFFAIRVHAWGGLGSQLFAISTMTNLKQIYPNKRFILVTHSSGVTRRTPAFMKLYPELKYLFKDDFTPPVQSSTITSNFLSSIKTKNRKFFKKVLTLFKIVLEVEVEEDFYSLRKWTLEIRGHYSHTSVTEDFLKNLHLRLQKSVKSHERNSYIALHYRLDDLLRLSDKSFISSKRVNREVLKVSKKEFLNKLIVFSDSPTDAIELLASSNKSVTVLTKDDTIEKVLFECATATYFIGTNSKISYWVCGLRSVSKNSLLSSLPQESKDEIEFILKTIEGLSFY